MGADKTGNGGKESADIWLYCINVRGCGKEDKREECLCREK